MALSQIRGKILASAERRSFANRRKANAPNVNLSKFCRRLGLNLTRSVKFDENGQNFAPEFKRIRKMIAIYFSSTGNTKHCAQRFIECLGRGIPAV